MHNYSAIVGGFGTLESELKVLKPLKDAYSQFETSRKPSIHLVVRASHKLLAVWGSIPTEDDPAIKTLRRRLCVRMVGRVVANFTVVHWMAAILCPSLKTRARQFFNFEKEKRGAEANPDTEQFYEAEMRDEHFLYDEAMEELKVRLKDTATDLQRAMDEVDDVAESAAAAAAAKAKNPRKEKSAQNMFGFDDLEDEAEPRDVMMRARVDVMKELEHYMEMKIRNAQLVQFAENPFEFWCGKEGQQFPTLSIVAKHILMVPSNSAAVERIFSQAAVLLNEYRIGRMEADKVGCCMRAKLSKPGL